MLKIWGRLTSVNVQKVMLAVRELALPHTFTQAGGPFGVVDTPEFAKLNPNRTVPVILCDADDVAGNHGATIGHIRPEQLLYLASRGISPDDAERLFIAAAYQEAATGAPDERTRAAVTRLAAARGITLEEAVA